MKGRLEIILKTYTFSVLGLNSTICCFENIIVDLWNPFTFKGVVFFYAASTGKIRRQPCLVIKRKDYGVEWLCHEQVRSYFHITAPCSNAVTEQSTYSVTYMDIGVHLCLLSCMPLTLHLAPQRNVSWPCVFAPRSTL